MTTRSASLSPSPVVFLLPLWGEPFIDKFLHFSLPSLLAPGNIPAMCQEYLCTFLFLTRSEDRKRVETHAAFLQLKAQCKVEFLDISDLLFDEHSGIHNVSVALAYERGMRSRGPMMLETYFFFLVSDGVVANDSFQHIKRHLREGCSGITIGAFRISEEKSRPLLRDRVSEEKRLSLGARQLLELSFQCLHAHTLAETVNLPNNHASFANRLFWRGSETVMVGRFYTRHMLCIKPEVDNYAIGAPCDYCFIAEMCPSGKVVHIQDSDDFCLVELSPSFHDKRYIRPGPFDAHNFAKELSVLTTDVHRCNAHLPIVYHCEELTSDVDEIIEESGAYIRSLEALLSPEAQPMRGHHVWTAAIDYALGSTLKGSDMGRFYSHTYGTFAGILGSPAFAPIFQDRTDDLPLFKLKDQALVVPKRKAIRMFLKKLFVGMPLRASIWHLQWPLDRCIKSSFLSQLEEGVPYLYIGIEPAPELVEHLETRYRGQFTYQHCELLLMRQHHQLHSLFCDKQGVFVWVSGDCLDTLARLLERCTHHLPPHCEITIQITHDTPTYRKPWGSQIVKWLTRMESLGLTCKETQLRRSFALAHLRKPTTHFATQLFGSGHRLRARLLGFFGLILTTAGCLLSNSAALLKIAFTRRITHSLIVLRLKS